MSIPCSLLAISILQIVNAMPKGATKAKNSRGQNDPTYGELKGPLARLIAQYSNGMLNVETDADMFERILKSTKRRGVLPEEETFADRKLTTGRYLFELMDGFAELIQQGVCTADGFVRIPSADAQIERLTYKGAQELQRQKEVDWIGRKLCEADVRRIKEPEDAQIISISYMSGQWFGKILGGQGVSLNAEWVDKNFFAPNASHHEGIEWSRRNNWFKEQIVLASPLYVTIPAGKASSEEQIDLFSVKDLGGYPLKFIQQPSPYDSRDWLGSSDGCAVLSLASAMAVFGDDQGARILKGKAGVIQTQTCRLKGIKEALDARKSSHFPSSPCLLYFAKILPKAESLTSILSILLSHPDSMFVAQLVCGDDGGVEHCVTFYAGHIFDTCGLFSTSYSLTVKSLDELCSSKCEPTKQPIHMTHRMTVSLDSCANRIQVSAG